MNQNGNQDSSVFNNFAHREGLDVKSILGSIKKHRWIVALSFAVITGITYYVTYFSPELYRSSATIHVSSSNEAAEVLNQGNAGRVNLNQTTNSISYFNVLKNTGAYNQRFQDSLVAELTKYMSDSVARKAASSVNSAVMQIAFLKESNDFIALSAVTQDPVVSFAAVNVGASLLKEKTADIQRESFQSTLDFIDKQLAITSQNLQKTESNLQSLQEKTDIKIDPKLVGETANPMGKLVAMKDKITELETQIDLAESNLKIYDFEISKVSKKLKESSGVDIAEGGPTKDEELILKKIEDITNRLQNAQSEKEIADLQKQKSELENKRYEMFLSKYSLDESVVPSNEQEALKTLLAAKSQEEIRLYLTKGQLKYYSALINRINQLHPDLLENSIAISQLLRDKDIYSETQNSLIQQRETFRIRLYGITGGLKIIDPPRIRKNPIPKEVNNVIIAAILSLVLGIGLAVAIDFFDHSIKSKEDLISSFDLSVIGSIPHIATTGDPNSPLEKFKTRIKSREVEVDKNQLRKMAMISRLSPRSLASESYRSLRTNVQFASIDNPMKSLVITSPGPSEGKTTTSINLALSFAEMGHKVLLIDADLMKPKHHTLFDIDSSPGLVDLILNDLKFDEVVKKSGNLDVLPVGENPSAHAELFSSIKMAFFMNEVEKHYDIIIYDTPPILLLTDSLIIASKVDGVVLVVKQNATDRRAIGGAIDALHKVNANLLGLLLNQTHDEKSRYYNYSYEGYYYYSEPASDKETGA